MQMARASRYRWVIVALCIFMSIVNYFDRSALGYFTTPLMKAFNLNFAQIGLLGSAFAIGYFFFTFIGGWMVDKIGARHLLGVTAILWGISTLGITIATGFWSLFIFRTILGIGEGPAFPAQFRAFSDWLPRSEQNKAVAASQPAAFAISLVVGGPLAALLFSLTQAWQTMFLLIGTLSIIISILWYWLFKENPKDSPYVNAEELAIIQRDKQFSSSDLAHDKSKIARAVPIIDLLKDRTLLSTYIAFFCIGYFIWFVLYWLPKFIEQTYQLKLTGSAVLSAVPWVLYGIAALISGYICDKRMKTKGPATKRTLIFLSLFCGGLLLIPVFTIHVMWVNLVFFSIAFGCAGLSIAPMWSLNSDVIPQRSGTSSGIMNASFALSGLLAPAITGFIVQQTGSFESALILITIACLGGSMAVLFMSRPDASAKKFADKISSFLSRNNSQSGPTLIANNQGNRTTPL
jgi:ACS family hexuronate transporter-like MFS transporter